MAGDHTFEFTDDNFQQEVLQSSVPVLVDFWAEWCQPCRMLAPTIDEVANDYNGKAKVGKMDVDSHREFPLQYGVQSIPTVILFKDGEVVKKFVGLTGKDDFTAALDELTA